MGDQLFQLTRTRVVLFLREPEAVFWVLVFPLTLALVLCWAFKDRGPSAEDVGVLGSPAEVAAVADPDAAKSSRGAQGVPAILYS